MGGREGRRPQHRRTRREEKQKHTSFYRVSSAHPTRPSLMAPPSSSYVTRRPVTRHACLRSLPKIEACKARGGFLKFLEAIKRRGQSLRNARRRTRDEGVASSHSRFSVVIGARGNVPPPSGGTSHDAHGLYFHVRLLGL